MRGVDFEKYDLGQLEGLYNPEYDPEQQVNEFGGLEIKDMLAEDMMDKHPELIPLFNAWIKCRQPLWLLNPGLFGKMGDLMPVLLRVRLRVWLRMWLRVVASMVKLKTAGILEALPRYLLPSRGET